MGKLTLRKHPLAIRKVFNTIKYSNKECYEKINELNMSSVLSSCPICKNTTNVSYTGTNRGIKKFVCKSSDHLKDIWFSATTSCEAIEVYRDILAKNLCLLTLTNSTVRGMTAFNETSKYFVELATEGMYQYIKRDLGHEIIEIDKKEDIVTIFLDISGSGLARNKAVILARIDDKTVFDVVTTSNYLSTHGIMAAIKEKHTFGENANIVFVTDGERCFVDSIKEFFPNAIHIRQFHRETCRGIVYVHFKYENDDYTLRCLWDSVLNDGEASKKVKKLRELKAKKRLERKEKNKKIELTDLSKDVVLWKGIVYMPRGTRKKRQDADTTKGSIGICSKQITTEKKTKKDKNAKNTNKSKKKTSTNDTSPHDTQEEIFRGKIEDAKNHSIMKNCFALLISIFGGLYITSNMVETIFNFKSKLYPHRTIKNGERLLVCVIYNCLVLKNKSKEWLMRFFKSEIITYDFVLNNVLYGSGFQKNRMADKKSSFLDIIDIAIEKKQRLIVHYRDGQHKHTARIITPKKIIRNEYNNLHLLNSYCHKREANRSFYVERIRDVAVYDPKPFIL